MIVLTALCAKILIIKFLIKLTSVVSIDEEGIVDSLFSFVNC